MEAQLGVTLFTRSRAGMALTDVGRVLADHTPRLLSAWETALRETRSADRRAARVLRVGFVASAANERTRDIIATPPDAGWWRDYWLATEERNGHPVRIGAMAHNPDEWLNAIANGYGVSLTPEATARFYQRPGVVYRPVTGVSPSHVGVAWPITDDDPIISDFIHACLLHRTPSR